MDFGGRGLKEGQRKDMKPVVTSGLMTLFMVTTLAQAYVVASSQNGRVNLQQALDELEDIRYLLAALKVKSGGDNQYSSPDYSDSAAAAEVPSSMSLRFGERGLGGHSFVNAYKPSTGASQNYQNLADVNRGNKRNYNLDHLARMNFRRSFRASKYNNAHILGGL